MYFIFCVFYILYRNALSQLPAFHITNFCVPSIFLLIFSEEKTFFFSRKPIWGQDGQSRPGPLASTALAGWRPGPGPGRPIHLSVRSGLSPVADTMPREPASSAQVLATVLLRSDARSPCISAHLLAGRALSSSSKLRLSLSLQLLHLKLVDQERAYAWQLEPRSGPPGRSIVSNPSGEIDRSTTLTCTVLASYSEFPKIYCTCAFSTRSQHS